ncbi:MAG: phage virion morphogenesis protein [Ramlibacter sp.]|nr:phage virion morphogenesis protein [Ramlibacter sp.]
MTDKLQIELVGAADMLSRLKTAAQLLDEPYELMDAIGAQLEGNVNLRFDTKTDAAGNAWAPVSPNTPLIWESIHGSPLPGTLLERTRLMRGSLAHNPSNDSVEVGFSAPYAGYHVTGTTRMPRRDPLFATVNADLTQGTMGAGDEADVLQVIESFLSESLG